MVPLGEIQRHVRGKVSYAVSGAPEVLAAMYTRPWKQGRFRSWVGESYIQMVRFHENGVELETINAYGASSKKDDPHATDQMLPFVRQELKNMTLDKTQIHKKAVRKYHPKPSNP